MDEKFDEFGIPIKSQDTQDVSQKKEQEFDEFGIPIKKKDQTISEDATPIAEDSSQLALPSLSASEEAAKNERVLDPLNNLTQENQEQESQEQLDNFNQGGTVQLDEVKEDSTTGLQFDEPRPKEDKGSFLGDIGQVIQKGSASLGAMLANTPEFIFRQGAVPQNYLAEKFPDQLGFMKTSPETFAKTVGLPKNKIAEFYEKDAAALEEKVTRFEGGIMENLEAGNYVEAAKNLTLGVAESLPVTLGMMATGAAGVSSGMMTAGGAAVFGAGKYEEIKDRDDLTESQKTLISTASGAVEGLLESVGGSVTLGKIYKNFIAKEGVEKGVKSAKSWLSGSIEEFVEKHPTMGSAVMGAWSEAMTTYSQNMIDIHSGVSPDKDPWDGVIDAGITGLFSEGLMGAPLTAAKIVKKLTKKDIDQMAEVDLNDKESMDAYIQDKVDKGEIKAEDADKHREEAVEQIEAAKKMSGGKIPKGKEDEVHETLVEKSKIEKKQKELDKTIAETLQDDVDAAENKLRELLGTAKKEDEKTDTQPKEEPVKDKPSKTVEWEGADVKSEEKTEKKPTTKPTDDVQPSVGEPTSVTASDGWTFVRMPNGEYTDGDQVYGSWSELEKVGKDEELDLKQSTAEREAEMREQETVQERELEASAQEFKDKLEVWNYINDETLKRMGYDSPMDMTDEDLEIHTNLVKKGVEDFESNALSTIQQANDIINSSIFKPKSKESITLTKNTTPTDKDYGTVDRGDGKGLVKLTKEEYLAEEGKLGIEKKSVDDLEKRQAEIEGSKKPEDKQEFNKIDKELESREWKSVMDTPLNEVNNVLDDLAKKEKEMPNGFGVYIDSKDMKESRQVVDRYSDKNKSELSDKEVVKDFTDAMRNNPTTQYASGLKLRESANEASKRGITFDKLLEEGIKIYTKDGFDRKTAEKVVRGMLEPVFKEASVKETTKEATVEQLTERAKELQGKIDERKTQEEDETSPMSIVLNGWERINSDNAKKESGVKTGMQADIHNSLISAEGGLTVEQLAEKLHAENDDLGISVQDFRNEINKVLQAGSKKKVKEEIFKSDDDIKAAKTELAEITNRLDKMPEEVLKGEVSVAEQKEINETQDKLSNEYDTWFNELNEDEQNDILGNYEKFSKQKDTGKTVKDSEGAKSKDDVLDEKKEADYESVKDLDTKDKTNLKKAYDFLDKIDKDLTKFGDETLGINIPIATAKAIVKTLKAAVKAGMTIEQAIKKAAKDHNVTDKDINNLLTPPAKPKAQSVESETTGLKPKEKFKQGFAEYVDAVKAKNKEKVAELKEVFKSKLADARQKNKDFKDIRKEISDYTNELLTALNKAGVKRLPTNRVKAAINNINRAKTPYSLSVAQDKALELVQNILLTEKEVQAKRDRKALAMRAKRNSKNGKFGNHDKAKLIATLKDVPSELIGLYDKAIANLGQRSANIVMDIDAIDEFYNEHEKHVQSLTPEADVDSVVEDKELTQEEIDHKNFMVESIVDKAKSMSIPDNFTAAQRTLVRQLKNIPKKFLETRGVKGLEALMSAMENAENGFIVGKHIQSIVTAYNSRLNSDAIINSSKGKNSSKRLAEDISELFVDKVKDIYKTQLTHIDKVLGNVKGTPIYKNFINPIARAIEAARNNFENEVEKKFFNKLNKAIKSRKDHDSLRLSAITEMYLRENEYNSNPDSKKLHRFIDHLEAIRDPKTAGDYSGEQRDAYEKVYEEFKNDDGSVDLDKVKKHLTKEENDLIDFMLDQNNGNLRDKNQFTNLNYRGEHLTYYENYQPRSVISEKDLLDIDTYWQSMTGGSNSLKTKSSNERGVKAGALKVDPFGAFLRNAKDTYTDFYVTPAVKESQITAKDIQNSEQADNISLGKALEKTAKDIIYTAYKSGHTSSETTLGSHVFNSIKNNVVKSTLISAVRLPIELLTNSLGRVINSGALARTRNGRKEFKDNSVNEKLHKLFGSTQMNRTGAFGVELSKDVSKLSKEFTKGELSAEEKATELIKENAIKRFTDALFSGYYKLADEAVSPVWQSHFLESFKKETGKDFDSKEFSKEDNTYSDNNKRAIEAAIATSDKQISDWYNTASQSEQKVNQQLDRISDNFISSLKHYMQSFTYNENPMLKDSFMSMFGKGTMEKTEGASKFLAASTRAIMHQVGISMLTSGILSMAGYDDDEEMLDKLGEEGKKGFSSYLLLLAMGNKSAWYKAGAALTVNFAHKKYKTYIKNEKYDKWHDDMLYAPQDVVGSMGYIGSVDRTMSKALTAMGKIEKKVANGGLPTAEDIVEMKIIEAGAAALGTTIGLPMQKEFKILQKALKGKGGSTSAAKKGKSQKSK